MDRGDVDIQLDRELKALPAPRAPRTLLPRVLAATVEQTSGRASGWLTWPLPWRLASIAVALLVVAGAGLLFTTPPASVSHAAATAGNAATVLRVFWDVLFQPVATYIFILGISLAFACALAWAALEAALGGASR